MAKEYPYRDLSDYDFWHLHLEQSAIMIKERGKKFVLGFSLVKGGVTKYFVSPEIGVRQDFTPYYKSLYSRLSKVRTYHRNSVQAHWDHVGWFINEAKNLQGLNPEHTTKLQ